MLDYFSDNSMDGKLLLFNRIQKICGLKFTHRVNEEFSKHKNCWVARGEQPLVFTAHPSHTSHTYWRRANSQSNRQDDTDLEEIGLRVKHMNIISYAQGHCLHLKGNMAWNNNPINAQRFFNMAMEKYEGQKSYTRALPPHPLLSFAERVCLWQRSVFPSIRTTTEALSSAPWSSDILVNCAEIATKFLEGEEKNLANLNFSINHPKGTARPFAPARLPRLIWCWMFVVLQRKRQTTIFCGRYRATPTTATPSSSTPSSWIAAASSRRPKSFISDRSRCVHTAFDAPPLQLTGKSLIARLASMRADQSQQRGVLAGVR